MLQEISITVIAAVMVCAVAFIIPTVLQVRRTAKEAERVLETVRTHIVPVSHDLSLVSGEVHGIVQSIHRQVEKIEDSVSIVQEGAERLRNFEEEVLSDLETHVTKLTALASGVNQGISTFFQVLLRRR